MQIKRNGFTLIEMLVVISIIGVLTALFLVNFMGARERSSDAARKADLNSMKTALRLYYNDYGSYPDSSENGVLLGCGPSGTSACGTSFNTSSTVYLDQLPEDMVYYQQNSGEGYILGVELLNQADQDITESQSKCGSVKADNDERYYVVCGQ